MKPVKRSLGMYSAVFALMLVFLNSFPAPAGASGIELKESTIRRNFLRMEENGRVGMEVTNNTGRTLRGLRVRVYLEGGMTHEPALPTLAPGEAAEIFLPVDTSLKPGDYEIRAQIEAPGASAETRVPVKIIGRPLPGRMPAVMWGGYGGHGYTPLDTLADMGFTHSLLTRGGLGGRTLEIWEKGEPADRVALSAQRFVDDALARNFRIAMYMRGITDIQRILDEKYLRIDRDGNRHQRRRVCGLYEELKEYCYNEGVSIARAYHDFPAWDSALIQSEVRPVDPCFHEHDYRAFREYSGMEIPGEAIEFRGVHYGTLPDFPRSRIVPDEYPLLQYYRWFWKEGDGWPGLHSAVDRGLKSTGRDDIWTWYDPATRAPSIWGSGGGVDILNHWTYTTPFPLSMEYTTDSLFAMAAGNPHQDVMKMTQIIWYRDRAAPVRELPGREDDRKGWEIDQHDARFLTISPDHLSIAFWSKLARPVRGIMYHGLQSLLPGVEGDGYRYTNPDTKHTLETLLHDVVAPLGPALLQVPDAETDIAFLKSFTSEILARKGTLGSSWSPAVDDYIMLRNAHIQPRIIYEEELLDRGLDGYSVLFMTDCDVLTESVARTVRDFQMKGGIVVGDEALVPGIMADITIPRSGRPPGADAARDNILERAAWLRENLDMFISRLSESDNPEVITRVRKYGATDYLFAYNDMRKFGDYVGRYGLVMEEGIPAEAEVRIRRDGGHAYDLVEGRKADFSMDGGWMAINQRFEPAQGKLWMITPEPIDSVVINTPGRAVPGRSFAISVAVNDPEGRPVNAVVPVEVNILSPGGEVMEYSGYYGARDGIIDIKYDVASNDAPGEWTVTARELASGLTGRSTITIGQ